MLYEFVLIFKFINGISPTLYEQIFRQPAMFCVCFVRENPFLYSMCRSRSHAPSVGTRSGAPCAACLADAALLGFVTLARHHLLPRKARGSEKIFKFINGISLTLYDYDTHHKVSFEIFQIKIAVSYLLVNSIVEIRALKLLDSRNF